jgi:hypothetical protein
VHCLLILGCALVAAQIQETKQGIEEAERFRSSPAFQIVTGVLLIVFGLTLGFVGKTFARIMVFVTGCLSGGIGMYLLLEKVGRTCVTSTHSQRQTRMGPRCPRPGTHCRSSCSRQIHHLDPKLMGDDYSTAVYVSVPLIGEHPCDAL